MTTECLVQNCILSFNNTMDKCALCNYGYKISENGTCIELTMVETPTINSTIIEVSFLETTIIETSNIYTTLIGKTIIETTIVETTLPDTTYIGMDSIPTTIIEKTIPETAYVENPSTFFEKNTNNFYTTLLETTFIETNDNPKTTNIFIDNDQMTSIVTNNIKNKLNCTIDEIINNKFINGVINLDQVDEIKRELLKINNSNILIKSENITIQITTPTEQNIDIPEVSNIDLGKCENLLKDHHNISKDESLIIFKIDIKKEDFSSTYVQYEIYNPKKEYKWNLDFFKYVPISINVPVKLDKNIDLIYDSLAESGYDLFNENDSFYQDICSTYTTLNGTDMLLSDRKKDIFALSQNQSLCQIGCDFKYYNSTSKKAKCDCENKKEEKINNNIKIDELFNKKEIAESFYNTLTNSNFQVLKCSKLLLSFSKIKNNNIGEISMIAILIIFLSLGFISFSISHKIITNNIKKIIENNFSQNSEIKSNIKKTKKPKKDKKRTKKIKNLNQLFQIKRKKIIHHWKKELED